MVLEKGPLKEAINDTEGVVKQELITYRIKNGMIYKEVVTRRFQGKEGDYIDHTSIEPLVYVS